MLAAAGGTSAQLSVTVSGGVVTAVNSVFVAGSFRLQSLLTGVTATGGGGSGAPFNLTANLTGTFINDGGINYPVSGTAASVSGGTCTTSPVAGTPVVSPLVSTLATTIAGFTDSRHVTLSATASTALVRSSQQIVYGHDDAAAFAACAATKNCQIPAATYLVGAAAIPNGGALIGHGAPGYAGDVAANPAAWQTLTPVAPALIASPLATNALNVLGASKVRLEGLFIDCVDQQRDGVSSGSILLHMQGMTINRCAYGLGTSGTTTDAYTHNSTFTDNQFSNNIVGLTNLIDSSVIAGALSANQAGAFLGTGASANTFTGVRVEWNSSAGLSDYMGSTLTIIGGLFDRNGGCGLSLGGATAVQVEGVQFHRNGANNDFTWNSNAHWCVSGGGQITFYNAQVATGVNDDGTGAKGPLYVGAYNTNGSTPNGVAVHGALTNGYTLSLWQAAPSFGFEYSGLGVDEYRNSQRPFIANGEVAQTLNTALAAIATGASASATLSQSSLTANYTGQSRELIISATNFNSPWQNYACRVNLYFYRGSSVGSPAVSPCYGEAGTAGTFSWGTSSELQGTISNTASDGSSFTFKVKNGASDGSNWGVWLELH